MKLFIKCISVLLCFVIAFSSFGICTYADEEDTGSAVNEEQQTEPVIQKTSVSGIPGNINALYGASAVLNLTITPASPVRTVNLQVYKSSDKAYKTVKTYYTQEKETASLKITIPKEYRKKAYSKWRIVIEKSDNAEKYVSKAFRITNQNIEQLSLNGRGVCIYCIETGDVIYSKNMNKQYKQASTTKIMTAMLLIESRKLNKKTKISKVVAKTPYSNLNMKAGDVYKNRDLLYALLLNSSNESACAIACSVSKNQKSFVKKMNKKAKKLGLKNTVYKNAHGLDAKGNHSTAYDIAKLLAYASKNKTFMKVIKRKNYSFTTVKYKQKKKFTSTDLMKSYSKNHLGGKTGYTDNAGRCFASVYKNGGKHYAVVTLGSKTRNNCWSDVKKLYKYIDKYAKEY